MYNLSMIQLFFLTNIIFKWMQNHNKSSFFPRRQLSPSPPTVLPEASQRLAQCSLLLHYLGLNLSQQTSSLFPLYILRVWGGGRWLKD